MNKAQRDDLLQQMLETETGGVKIYEAALECVLNPDLREEWEKYLQQTKNHVEIVRTLMAELGVEARETPSRRIVRHLGDSLVGAMTMARRSEAPAAAAEIVACECVVLAETKDHSNWELLSRFGEAAKGEEKKAIMAAIEAAEDEEDEHIYHSKGWCRELAIAALGMKAVLPPPEEQKDVKTAIGAARAKGARKQMM
ncbi:MAG: demethoxyubiquinone hydroxylase family protein [Alphaproteobacteria bacterium]|nr:demethoxyubiquinone hydroxylase family protein [Alphaproteobacteria bacterium]MCW5743996.1 demethoxyubiquinone hydroxylase family protein [Alphaproteobacteria bacterium]